MAFQSTKPTFFVVIHVYRTTWLVLVMALGNVVLTVIWSLVYKHAIIPFGSQTEVSLVQRSGKYTFQWATVYDCLYNRGVLISEGHNREVPLLQ